MADSERRLCGGMLNAKRSVMRLKLWLVLLCIGIVAFDPRSARAQQRVTPRDTHPESAAPASAEPASSKTDTTSGAVAGCAIGFVLGLGIGAALYVSTEPEEPTASQKELHGSEGESSPYGDLERPLILLFIGLPVLIGTTILGGLIGSRAFSRQSKTAAPAPTASMTVTPLASVSPDGGYLGARLNF